jgi:threonine dehydratase
MRPEPTLLTELPLGVADIEDAARSLSARVVRTPVLQSTAIDAIAGSRMLLKAENLQLSGSYKIRGAMHAIGRVASSGRHSGVVAQSTGNHGLAVALAAQAQGLSAEVVLPAEAPPMKVAKAREYGATVRLVGTTVDERLAVVRRIAAATGHAVVDAYDHPDVIAGQGTASLELIEEAAHRGTPLDALVVPVGGGGGIAGACLAAAGRGIDVYGVEPVGCDSLARSLAAGSRQVVPPAPTLADGLTPSRVGELPFAIARRAVTDVVRVGDEAIAHALRLALLDAKVLVEPSAAAGLAGALQIAAGGRHRTIGVVLTGGNVESTLVARLMSEHVSGGAQS